MEKVVIKFDGKFWIEKEYWDKIGKIGKKEDKIYLEPEEVLYVLEKGWGILKINNKEISKEEFLKKFINNINYKLYLVLREIRDLGYYFDIYNNTIVVHEKGKRDKPIYLVYPIFENERLRWRDVLELLEKAREMGCKLLLGIIDFEYDIVFYEIAEKNM